MSALRCCLETRLICSWTKPLFETVRVISGPVFSRKGGAHSPPAFLQKPGIIKIKRLGFGIAKIRSSQIGLLKTGF